MKRCRSQKTCYSGVRNEKHIEKYHWAQTGFLGLGVTHFSLPWQPIPGESYVGQLWLPGDTHPSLDANLQPCAAALPSVGDTECLVRRHFSGSVFPHHQR